MMCFLLQTPGPGAYHVTDPNLYKNKTPHYSMTSRNPMPGDSTQKPGPGAHSPERVCIKCNILLVLLLFCLFQFFQ